MVKKGRLIGLLVLLLLIGLLSGGGWLLTTRAGALWLFERFGTQTQVKVVFSGLEGSLLHGFEFQDLKVDWPGGELSADQLQFTWQPTALLQKQLKIDLLRGGQLALRLAGPPKTAAPRAADETNLIPDVQPLFSSLGNWSLELHKLQIEVLQLTDAAGKITRLEQIAGVIQGSAAQLSLSEVEIDGDWGRWRGDLTLLANTALLSGQLSWAPPNPFGPIETLEAQLSLTRTPAGRLHGPVVFKSSGQQAASYRLAGELRLDLAGLELQRLQFDRGSEAGGIAKGELRLKWQPLFSWQADLDLSNLNLLAELGQATRLNGQLHIKGEQSRYAGRIDLRNLAKDWQQLRVTAELEGDAGRLSLTQIEGSLLGGEIAGQVALDWREGISSNFKLQGHGLHLEQLPDGPDGQMDLSVDAWLKNKAETGLQLGGSARISKGVLLEREFSGDLRADWQGGRKLRIDSLDFNGAWGRLRAQGDLQKQLSFNLDLRDATALWPPLSGAGELDGWLAWTSDWPQGAVKGQLKRLAYQDWQVADLTLAGTQPVAAAAAELHLNLTDLQKGELKLAALELNLQGLPRAHQIQLQLNQGGELARLVAQGDWHEKSWRGEVSALELSSADQGSFRLTNPFSLNVAQTRLGFSEILLSGDKGGQVRLTGDWNRQDERLRFAGGWKQINLSLLTPWLPNLEFDGPSNGEGSFSQDTKTGLSIDLHSDYVGTLSYAGEKLQLDKMQIAGHWDKQGLGLSAELLERSGCKLSIQATSPDEVGLALPQQTDLDLELKDIPLGLLNPKMAAGQEFSGLLVAKISGSWFRDGHFVLSGESKIAKGSFRYTDGQSRLEIPFEETELNFDWQPDGVVAKFSLGLGEGDGLAGDLRLRLPAQWPFERVAQAPVSGEVQVHLGKLGALSLLIPEQLADFSGEIGGALRLAGQLQSPDFTGDLQLLNGRLRMSQMGIVLEQIGVKAVFGAQKLKIEQITLKAGEGQLKGTGEVQFTGWKPEAFRIELQGEDALIANLPELRAVASPDLLLTGNAEGLTLSGTLNIPELQIINWHPPGRVIHSEDVVFVDQMVKPEAPKAFKFKLDLGVELGERVVVKEGGLDVRLKGSFHLKKEAQTRVFARGQIDIPSGHYSTYGVKLPITSGRLYFNGGPADNPALDIIAMKKFDEVSAGVAVGGTARQPVIRLVSDPTLDDTDILSYIVLGRPTLGGGGDLNVLSLAAGALLSAGDSASLKQRLQTRSGIDVIDVNTGSEGGLESAVVTVGKYLTPELYLSYGRALTSSASQLQLRYSPSRRVDIESQLGAISGADIYYKIEFN